MIKVREETPHDRDAVRLVNRLAFGGADEADLVDRLHREDLVVASLVAIDGPDVVGHVLFSELPVEGAKSVIRAAALAPMAVLPKHQGRGIGSALVVRGLDVCRRRGVEAVIVLGHETYYPRFGFSAARAQALSAPFSGPAFMALELVPGVLGGGGVVRYPPAFGLGEGSGEGT